MWQDVLSIFKGRGEGQHHSVMVMKNQATAEHKFGGEPASCSGSGESVSAQLLISLIDSNCLTGNIGEAQDSHLKIAIQVAILLVENLDIQGYQYCPTPCHASKMVQNQLLWQSAWIITPKISHNPVLILVLCNSISVPWFYLLQPASTS